MDVAEFLASELHRRGVRYVFGIPGGPSIPYMNEFRKVGIEFILTSSETAAGVMADVTGRLTGIPGVCHATYGPGATNLSTGVGSALLDRSPMIVLTTEVPVKLRQRTMQMNIDHQMLFEPLTKATSVMDPANAGDIINDAFDLSLSELPGPVHIGLPDNIAGRQVIVKNVNYESEEWDQETSFDGETAYLLEYSKKPLLVVGLSAARNSCGPEIESFLKDHPMPVIITPMAKGVISENNPTYAGVFFHALSDRLKTLIDECDIVISIGYDPVEYNYEEWLPDVPLIHINTTITDMPSRLMVKQVTGSLAGIPEMLSPLLPERFEWDMDLVRKVRDEVLAPLKRRYRNFSPVTLLKTVRSFLPDEGILTLDVGSHVHLFGQLWRTPLPEKLIMTNGWSSMGFSLPAAIAAKLNFPDMPVISITGDGGFLMVAGEVMTARRYGLKIIIIVLTDGELNLIKLKQNRREVEPCGVDLYNNDLFGSDTFLDVPVLKVIDNDSLRKALKRADKINGPVIIDAAIDKTGYLDTIVIK